MTNLKINNFNYQLPEELIAHFPPKVRGTSNLLVLNRETKNIKSDKYYNLVDYLKKGDCLVINDTKVIKARLIVSKNNGAKRELILLENHGQNDDWFRHKVLCRGRIRIDEELNIAEFKIIIEEVVGDGVAIVKSTVSLLDLCQKFGSPPLPPYIKRQADSNDVERYQTVFAREIGSVAAPTASLNMTSALLKKIEDKGVKIVYLTLHVGLGTFLPIRVDDLAEHQMHQEYFEISEESLKTIRQTKRAGKSVVALGTTVSRTLEYAASEIMKTSTKTLHGEADIFIYPGYQFKIVDSLVTNFHAPKSTVLMMAAAFAGWDFLMEAYTLAIAQKMNFLSYGDSMIIF